MEYSPKKENIANRREKKKMSFAETNQRLNELGGIILDAAITVHKELGPGLLESV